MKKVGLIFLLCISLCFSGCTKATIEEQTNIIEANPNKGFNFDYLLYLPANFTGDTIVVSALSGTGNELDGDFLQDKGIEELEDMKDYAKLLNMAIMIVLIPRLEEVYLQALDASSLAETDDIYSEIDEQVLKMISNARLKLKQLGIKSDKKVVFLGFSSAGQFAHRFAVLHPEAVKAVAAGGLGSQITVPLENFNGCILKYPIGIADLDTYGIRFDLNDYNKVPQFIFQGALDTNNAVFSFDGYTGDDIGAYYNLFSGQGLSFSDPVNTWSPMVQLIESMDNSIEFKLYDGVGHTVTPEIKVEIVSFLQNIS